MKVYPSPAASETLPTEDEEKILLDPDVALKPESAGDFYILEEELIRAEQMMIPPFEKLLKRARVENSLLLSEKSAKKKNRLETVTAMFCGVLRLDPANRLRSAKEVARELRCYGEQHAPRGVHPWRWLLGLEASDAWEKARQVCPGTTEQDLEAQFMITWATAPPRVGYLSGEVSYLARTCPVRTHLERSEIYLFGISILYWMQRLMDLCGEPWHMSGKEFGEYIGVKQPTAWGYLKRAQTDGLLERTDSLNPQQAYERGEAYSYKFHLDQVSTTTNTSDTRVSREARRHGTATVSINRSLVLEDEEGNGRRAEVDEAKGPAPSTTVPQAGARGKRERKQRPATEWLDRDARLNMVLSKLEKVARSGEEHKACCPRHKGKKQNLTIKAGRRCVVLRCHRGCETEQIVAAIGLSMSDLFWDPPA